MKNYLHYLAAGVVIVVGIIFLGSRAPTDQALGGISRTVSYATSTVATSSATQVLSVNTRAKYRSIQNDTNSTIYCFLSATSTATVTSNGRRLTQGQIYEVSNEHNNLWPGAFSCIASTTVSTVLLEEHYE
jgi:hypothetical protein